jgi:cytochrome c
MIRVTLTIPIFVCFLIFHSTIYAQADMDIVAGELVYAKCIGCHSPAYHRTGPKHCGLVGRQAGSESGFTYTAALKNSGIIWTTETLDIFLTAPLKMIPGTNMGFSGISSSVERSLLIRYLSRLNEDNPLCNFPE